MQTKTLLSAQWCRRCLCRLCPFFAVWDKTKNRSRRAFHVACRISPWHFCKIVNDFLPHYNCRRTPANDKAGTKMMTVIAELRKKPIPARAFLYFKNGICTGSSVIFDDIGKSAPSCLLPLVRDCSTSVFVPYRKKARKKSKKIKQQEKPSQRA